MTGVRPVDALTLSGPPRKVRAVVSLDVANVEVIPIAINIEKQPSIFRAVLRPTTGGKNEIRLRLPDLTAPGSYNGEATINGKPRAIIVVVEPQARLSVQPVQTLVTVEPASSASFALTLVNEGNATIEVPKGAAFDLDDADGQDRALGRSLRAAIAKGEQRVERFMEELRLSHGGEARITVRSGAGPLRSGEERDIKCSLDVPDSAKAGRSYTGSWDIGPTPHVIVASIITSSRPIRAQSTP